MRWGALDCSLLDSLINFYCDLYFFKKQWNILLDFFDDSELSSNTSVEVLTQQLGMYDVFFGDIS